MNLRRAIFLDRDGTIIENVHHLTKPEDIKLIDGAGEAIKLINDKGFMAIIVTNQSVIGRKKLTVNELHNIHNKLIEKLIKFDACIDDIYYCPHMPEDNCSCRKPNTGLIKNAEKEHNIDIKQSYMIGDNISDIIMAEKAGCEGVLVRTGHGIEFEKKIDHTKTQVYNNLLESINNIL